MKRIDSKTIFKMIKRYPNKIPIYCFASKNSTLKKLKKNKYLVPDYMTLGQFMVYIRKQINLKETENIFSFYK